MSASPTIPEHVEYSVVDGKALLLDTERGGSVELDAVGTTMWELIAEELDLEEILRRLLQIYDVDEETLRKDFQAFLVGLTERGLLLPPQAEAD